MEHNSAKHRKITLIVLLSIIVAITVVVVGIHIYRSASAPSEYMITTKNHFDYQENYECSGYASAYVLRSLGINADGLDLYGQFTDKNEDGTLAAIYLCKNLNQMGYKCRLNYGTLTDVKYFVSRGTPVIALLRVNTYEPYLHYVPIVGYDDNYLYAADSLDYLKNEENENYNRKISAEDFKELWKTDVFMTDNIFLTIDID